MKKRPLHVIEQPSEDGTNISSSKNSNKKRHVEVSITSDSESNIESESDNDTVLETGQIISVAVENFMCHRYFGLLLFCFFKSFTSYLIPFNRL